MPPGERLHPLAENQQQTDRGALARQGNTQHASHADPALEGAKGVFRIALGVIDEHGCIFEKDARAKRPAAGLVIDFHDRTVVFFR